MTHRKTLAVLCMAAFALAGGAQAQQHTFTIALVGGGETRIKGRNLYKHGIFRKPWADESARTTAANEKHARGDRAPVGALAHAGVGHGDRVAEIHRPGEAHR